MTVASTQCRIEYLGAGSVGPYAIPFYFLNDADISAATVVAATGAQTPLVLGANFSLIGAGVPAGGSLTLVVVLPVGSRLIIWRDPSPIQNVDYTPHDPLAAEVTETAFDRLVMLVQRIRDIVLNRALRFPDGDTVTTGTLPNSVDRAGKYLAFDSQGLPIAAAAPVGGGGGAGTVTNVSGGATAEITVAVATGATTPVITASINANNVAFAKIANVATGVILGRTTAGAGSIEALIPGQARTVLGLGTMALAATGDYIPIAGGNTTGPLGVGGAPIGAEILHTQGFMTSEGATAGANYSAYWKRATATPLTGQPIAGYDVLTWDGAASVAVATITVRATQNHAAGVNGTRLQFRNTANGTAAVREVASLDEDGTFRKVVGGVVIAAGGAYEAGSIYSDANWGMLFRALTAAPVLFHEFGFVNSAATMIANISKEGSYIPLGGRIASPHHPQFGARADYDPAAVTGWDDAAAIQNCCNWLADHGGGVCQLEASFNGHIARYRLNSAVTVPVGVTLRGPHVSVSSGFFSETPFINTPFNPSVDLVIGSYSDYTTDIATDRIQRVAHGWLNNQVVALVTNVFVPGSVPPTGIVEGTRYFIVNKTANDFQLSATLGGAAINLTVANGVGSLIYNIVSTGGDGMGPRDKGGSIWITFDAGRGDGTATYNVADAAALPTTSHATRTQALMVNGSLEGLYIFSSVYNFGLAAVVTDNAIWNSAWNGGTFAGLAVRANSEDCNIRNCFIGGFMQAVLQYGRPRGTYENVLIDCVNGLEIIASLDNTRLKNVHAYPFCAIGSSISSLARLGTFLYMHGSVDWPDVVNCFTFGHKNGFMLYGVNSGRFVNIGADNHPVAWAGTKGIYLKDTNTYNVFTNCHTSHREYGVYLEHLGLEATTILGHSAIGCNTGVYLLNGDACIVGGVLDCTDAAATKTGIENAGAGVIHLVTPTFVGCTNNTVCTAAGRIRGVPAIQGGAVASINNVSWGPFSSRRQITGAVQINTIDAKSRDGGTQITLHFLGAPTVKHNQAAVGDFKPIMLAGAVDFVASANDQLRLEYDSTDSKWYEIARCVI